MVAVAAIHDLIFEERGAVVAGLGPLGMKSGGTDGRIDFDAADPGLTRLIAVKSPEEMTVFRVIMIGSDGTVE